jgi:glutamate racemase
MLSSASGLRGLIAQRAADDPDHVLYEDARSDRVVDAAALDRLVGEWHERFRQAGLGPSSAVLVDVDDPLAIAVLQLAVVSGGHRALTLDHGSGAGEPARLATLIRGAGMTVGDRGTDRAVDGVPFTAVGDGLGPGEVRDGVPAPAVEPAGAGAAVLFTSGSTGTP